jgi:hypothetical protein
MVFPIIVGLSLPSPDGGRWIRNNLSFSVFLITMFPVAVGTFVRTFNWKTLRRLPPRLRRVLLVGLVVFAGLAIAGALDDVRQAVKNRIIEPFSFRDFADTLGVERELRAEVAKELKTPEEARAAYLRVEHPFTSVRDFLDRASAAAYWAVLLNLLSGVFLAVFFWHIIVLVLERARSGQQVSEDVYDSMVLVFGLLVTWFPMRLYAEWYINFGAPDPARYNAFAVLLGAALVGGALLFILKKPGNAVTIFSGISAGLSAILTFLGKWKQGWLGGIARALESLDAVNFIILEVVLLCFLGVLASVLFWSDRG